MLLFALPLAAGMAARTWLANSRATGGPLELGLLPFALTDALHPGETRDVWLFEERFSSCLADAVADHAGCIGAILFADDGVVVPVSTVCEIEDWKVSSTNAGVWARLRCVARCRLTGVRTHEAGGYSTSAIELYPDAAAASAEPALVEELRAVHAGVACQRRQLFDALTFDGSSGQGLPGDRGFPASASTENELIHVGPDSSASPFGLFWTSDEDDEDDEDESGAMDVEEAVHVYVGEPWERPTKYGTCFFNCRDPGELDDEENGHELSELLATRRAVLMRSAATAGADGGPDGASALHEAIGELWGVGSEEELERQMLSFALTATLGPDERATALLCTNTAARFRLARESLLDQHEMLEELLETHGERVG